MIDKLFGEYLPATLTFIVGLLGILSQLSINFFSERNKYKLEINKTKMQNIYDFYLPLLLLARKYKYYQTILLKSDLFTLWNWNYPQHADLKIQYGLLKEVYAEIETLAKAHYIPTEYKLNKEIQDFNKHVILVNCLWKGECQNDFFQDMIPETEVRGYDVTSLINELETVVGKNCSLWQLFLNKWCEFVQEA